MGLQLLTGSFDQWALEFRFRSGGRISVRMCSKRNSFESTLRSYFITYLGLVLNFLLSYRKLKFQSRSRIYMPMLYISSMRCYTETLIFLYFEAVCANPVI